MLRVADPGGASLPRVSNKIRSLQDRLMDSLPTDGAWECLSPAQREAILSLHHNRLFGGNNNTGEEEPLPVGASRNSRKPNTAMVRYTRSRSYEDKLESETDDSGARGLGGSAGTSSGSHSHNSQEDDSSDPGVNRSKNGNGSGGIFTKSNNIKSLSVDRANQRQNHSNVVGQYPIRARAGVTNGFGNVNKMISKQINKNVGINNSNITLDCRNVLGEKRRRSCIFPDDEDPFRSGNFDLDPPSSCHRSPRGWGANTPRHGDPVPPDRAALSRRKILNKYETEVKGNTNFGEEFHNSPKIEFKDYNVCSRVTPSSEEYDSGVTFRFDSSQDGGGSHQFSRDQPKSFSSYTDNNCGTKNMSHNFSSLHNGYYSGNFMNDSTTTAVNGNATNTNSLGGGRIVNNNHTGMPNSYMHHRTSGLHQSSNNNAGIEFMNHDDSASSMLENNLRIKAIDYSHSGMNSQNITKSVEMSRSAILRNVANNENVSALNTTSSVIMNNKLCNGNNIPEPLKSNLKSGCGDKMNSSLDYRSTMNQDAHNRYSSNWNEIILNNQVNSKINVKYDAYSDDRIAKTLPNPLTKSTGNLSSKAIINASNSNNSNNINNNINTNTHSRNEVNFLHNDLERWDNFQNRLSPKKYVRSKSLDRKYLEDSSEDESDFEARRRFERERRYARNPEWDALRSKQVDTRLRKFNNNISDIRSSGREYASGRLNKVNWESNLTTDISGPQQHNLQKPKACSVWDLSRSSSTDRRDEFEDPMQMMGCRSRGEMISRWQNIDRKLNGGVINIVENDFQSRRGGGEEITQFITPTSRGGKSKEVNNGNEASATFEESRTLIGRRKEEKLRNSRPEEIAVQPTAATTVVRSPTMDAPIAATNQKIQWSREFIESREFSQKQWRRRSCDFELDAPNEALSQDHEAWDRKRWYRRSCDLDLDFDQHYRNKSNNLVKQRDLSNMTQQFQSLPPYHDGLQVPEEIILDKKRCLGRREGRPLGPINGPPSSNIYGQLTQEELRMLDSGHEMFLVDKTRIPIKDSPPARVDGRSKSRMEEHVSNRNNLNNARKGRIDERPKTSIGHYGKEKKDRSRTPHVLKGKLRLFKSILSF